MAAWRSAMERKTPRLRRFRVSAEKKFSTALSQEPEVGVVEGPARMAGEPSFDFGVLMGGVVIKDGVDRFVGRHRALDGVEEADEFLMGMALHATAEDDAIERVEGGKQGGRAVALVVMRHGPALAGLERQTRLGAIERLDLRFLGDANEREE